MKQQLLQKLQPGWIRVQTWFDSRNSRERVLVSGLLFAVVITAWLLLINDPVNRRIELAQIKVKNLSVQLQSITRQQTLLTQTKRVDPDYKIKQRIENADTRIAQLDTQLKQRLQGLIEPTQMAQILEQILTQSTSMRLTRIESLAAKPLIEIKTEESTDPNNLEQQDGPGFGVFQHGLKMEFEGNYLGTLDYLQKLQDLPWPLFWDGVTLEVSSYPTARVIITVHTLSLEEGWLGV